MILALVTSALAHGGEDHGAPTVPVVDAGAMRVPMSSEGLDAVLLLASDEPGVAGEATLLVADAATSAPADVSAAALTLAGPASVSAAFSRVSPGVLRAPTTLPAVGSYAGSIVVQRGDQADLLGVPSLTIDGPVHAGSTVPWAWLAGAAAVAFAGILAAAVAGFVLGRRGVAGVIAILALGGAGRVSAHGGEDHGAPAATGPVGAALSLPMESQFLLGLRTVRVYREPFQERVLGLGVLAPAPGGAAVLRAPFGGTLEAPAGGFPTPGTTVRAGDVLGMLHESATGPERASLAQERADAATRVAEAQAALALAERDSAQIDALGEALSERERLERAGRVASGRVALAEAEAAAQAIGRGLQVPIRAPLSGRVAAVLARPGDQVEPGAMLFRVVAAGALWVEARVPEGDAEGVVSGQPAEVEVPGAPGRTFPAVVLDGGLVADPETGTVTVTLAVEADPALKPGMAASAWIPRGPTEDALVVPDEAVVESNGVFLAFVKTGPERFAARDLVLGGRGADRWEVHGGLAPGDRVVVAAMYSLKSLAGR